MRLTSHENDTGLSSTAHGGGSSRSKVKLGCGAETAAYPPRVSDERALQHGLSLPWALCWTEVTRSVLSTLMIF